MWICRRVIDVELRHTSPVVADNGHAGESVPVRRLFGRELLASGHS
jgi:hypothetical protein